MQTITLLIPRPSWHVGPTAPGSDFLSDAVRVERGGLSSEQGSPNSARNATCAGHDPRVT